jgi:hypothetical protein
MRNKTELRYVDRKTGKVTKVTEEDGKYFIGDTNERAEGRMTHYKGVKNIGSKYKEIGDEWSDFAFTSDDL